MNIDTVWTVNDVLEICNFLGNTALMAKSEDFFSCLSIIFLFIVLYSKNAENCNMVYISQDVIDGPNCIFFFCFKETLLNQKAKYVR